MDLEGKVCLITGGAQGIGHAMTVSFIQQGAKVAICDFNSIEGKRVEQTLQNQFGVDSCIFIKCDVRCLEEFEACFQKVLQTYGVLDILINNAAVVKEEEISWEETIDVNLKGTINGTILGVKYMKQEINTSRAIVNIASTLAINPLPTKPIYSSTKAAVLSFTRSLGAEIYQTFGIRFIVILPGFTETPILKQRGYLFPGKLVENLSRKLKDNLTIQTPAYVAACIVDVLKQAKNGSIWSIENMEPPKQIFLELMQ